MGPGRAKRAAVPGGSCQYYAVQQYCVVRRVWGASGVAGFLIFAPPALTPPQNLIAEILSTPVRCRVYMPCKTLTPHKTYPSPHIHP